MGEDSPLGRLYDLDARILLLGTGHASNSSFHLAEYRVPTPRRHQTAAAVRRRRAERGSPTTTSISTPTTSRRSAPRSTPPVAHAWPLGAADARLLRQRDAVDFAVGWLQRHRR